jgi:2-methylcitrate dehydratase PrpD
MEQGTIDEAAFVPEAYLDERIRPMMRRISVRIADDAEKAYPDDVLTRFLVTEVDGGQRGVEVLNPPGHEKNPMTSDQVNEKFLRLTTPHLGAQRADEAAAFWRTVTEHADLDRGFELLATQALAERT